MSEHRITAAVLAAGLSSRCPGNKLFQVISGKPVVWYAVHTALLSRASDVVVVAGHEADLLHEALSDLPARIIYNQDYACGLSSSLKCAVCHVPPENDGIVLLLGDMPYVKSEVLDGLMDVFNPIKGREICVPTAKGRRGNPVLWGRRFFAELMTTTGDKGGRDLIEGHRESVAELSLDDDGVLLDIDTPDDLLSAYP